MIEPARRAAGRSSDSRIFPEGDVVLGPDDIVHRTGSVPSRTVSVNSQTRLLGNGPATSWQPADEKNPWHLTWAQDRKVVLSEMIFKIDQFCKTTLYEMLPIPVATVLCTLLDGWQQARNRFAGVFCCIVLPIFDLALQPMIAYALYFKFSDMLSPSSGYEVLGFVFLPSLARAMTLGVKYALYSDLLLSVDQELSLASREYEKKGCDCDCVFLWLYVRERMFVVCLLPS